MVHGSSLSAAPPGAPRACHQDAALLTLSRALEGTLECGDVVVAAEQARGGGEPQRKVALAQRELSRLAARQEVAQAGEITGEAVGALVAPLGLFLEQAHDDGGERGRDPWSGGWPAGPAVAPDDHGSAAADRQR
jgi:hypothetical protein